MESAGHKIGLFSGVALVAGACIGSAIFSISGLTIAYAGASAILSWLAAALLFCAYGTVVVRLVRRHPHSGGIYIFPKREIGGRAGSFLGFVCGWGYIVSNILAIAFSAICMGPYLQAAFPGLDNHTLLALLSCFAALCILLCGVHLSKALQNILVILMAASLLVFCLTAFFGGGFDISGFKHFFVSGSRRASGFISSIPLALVAYGGCVVIAFLADEVDNPAKTIPGALFTGIGLVALLYLAVIASVVGTLPVSTLKNDPSCRLTPLMACVYEGSLYSFPWLVKVIALSASLALLTTINALMRVNAMALETLAHEGLMPEFLFRENRQGTPYAALLTVASVSSLLCLRKDWTEGLINMGAVINVVTMAVICTSLICAERKGRVLPAAVILMFLACYIPGIAASGWKLWAFTTAVYAFGIALYLIFARSARPRLSGIVVHGKGHGHLHGMPTANLATYKGQSLPTGGVWRTRAVLSGRIHPALTHIGRRPSDDDSPEETVETMILDFDKNIYGEEMTLIFDDYERPTMTFPDLDALKNNLDDYSKPKERLQKKARKTPFALFKKNPGKY